MTGPASEALAIREAHETLKQKVAAMAIKHGEDILQDYTLSYLTFVLEYDLRDIPARKRPGRLLAVAPEDYTLGELIGLAGVGRLSNMTSVHRAITDVKTAMQTTAQRKAALKQEAFWGEAMNQVRWED